MSSSGATKPLPRLVDSSPPLPAEALPPLTSPAPTQDSPPAPPPEQLFFFSPPPPPSLLNASAPSPSASLSSPPPSSSTVRSPPPPPSSKTARSPPPPPPPSRSPPPPSPPSPSSKPTPSPPPPPPHVISSSPPPPASKSSSSTSPSSSSSSVTAPSPVSSPSSTISGGSLIAIGITGVIAVSVLAVLFYCLCRKKKKHYYNGVPPLYKDSYYGADLRKQQEWCSPASDVLIKIPPLPGSQSMQSGYDPIPSPPKGGGSPGIANSKSWFTYQELAAATDEFAKSNELGEGGFGCVYKGTLSDGQLVAVKQLKAGASQGEKEFRAEVDIISRVHHRHLVSLVGYCIADRQRLLVYDYVPNGTLEWHLHKRDGGPSMDWPTRLRIACGAARGLAYLHEDCHPRIIHRDIKSSNILLDNNFEAQVSDFGLAKLTSDTNTHVTTRVMGTFGYLAPEYASSGKLTDKSDVFSFGVVMLELLTGRKPVDPSQPAGEESLVEWARPVIAQISSEEDLRGVADPSLNGAYDAQEMMRMMEAAAACVRHSANKRPRMGQVVRALEDEISLSDLSKGLKPGHSSAFGSSFASSEYENGGSYSADMRKYMRVALDSTQEFGSECSGATSEYGLNASVSSGEYKMSRETEQNFSQQRPMPSREMGQNFSQQHPMFSREMDQNFSQNRPLPSREMDQNFGQNHPMPGRGMDQNFSQQRPMPSREMDQNFSQQRPMPSREIDQNYSQLRSIQSRDMDQNFSHQRPMSMNMRNNVHLYDTQQFRMGN